ncbi:MAG: tetratricopeptide repeat protein, partial [Acidobacteriaceae bacterium]|nr:tetratricopeptide repeat protein [Acidobacteriaceae bacterium]
MFCFLALAMLVHADEPSDPVSVYKSGDYVRAIPLLQQAVAKNPKDAVIQAALLSALVYQGQVDEATDAADGDAQNFLESPDVLSARGDLAFYMGDMPAAENLYKSAIKIKEGTARAHYGLYRMFHAASMYRSARLLCMRAHQLDPDDALITLAFTRYLIGEKRREFLPPFIQAHPWFYRRLQQMEQNRADLHDELEQRKPFERDSAPEELTLPLSYLRDGPRIMGVTIQMSIEGRKPMKLVLDSGASGIVLSQAAIDKAGLNHVGSFQVGGIGDKGMRDAFLSVADTCSVGKLKFKTCIFQATTGKRHVIEDEDGLLGTDLFSDYLITIDFQRLQLHLVPLPERTVTAQGYDRAP